ncbi:MAG TPA: sigma-70 family RNA polymerase sigma factor [Candidatus Acidoferrum sp.]|nr:sigma-70 family RNA polymerase sigma factor [Candidatus Acidoferrum sp.]
MDQARERDLVARSRADGAAFGELYDFYLPRLYGFVYRRVGERSAAEDVTATAFERALTAVRGDDFKNDSFGGWLYRVAANAIVDHVRAGRRLVPLDAATGDEPDAGTEHAPRRSAARGRAARVTGDEAAFDSFSGALERDQLAQAIRRLPDTHRRVLVLRFYDDLEIDEICGLLGCTRANFAVKLHRALGALRGALLKESIDAA